MAANRVQRVELPLSQNQTTFLAALRTILPSLKHQSDSKITERIGHEKLVEVCDDFFGFIDSAVDSTPTQNEYYALSCQILRCLSKYLTETMQIPTTINTIPNQMGMLEWSVDEAYPGYAKNRMLKWTIKMRNQS